MNFSNKLDYNLSHCTRKIINLNAILCTDLQPFEQFYK